MADGSIIINTRIDNAEARKDLVRLQKDINNLKTSLGKKQASQNAISAELDQATAAAEKTRANIKQLKAELATLKAVDLKDSTSAEYLTAQTKIPQIEAELQQQEALLNKQAQAADKLAASYQKATNEVDRMGAELEQAVQKHAQLESSIASGRGMAAVGNATEEASKRMNKFGKRIVELAKSALIFSVLTAALTRVRQWLGRVIKTNDEAVAALAQLKGAFATLAQPLLNVVIPAFVTFVNVLTKIINALARVVSFLFGTTFGESQKAAEGLNAEQEALEGVGGAAKDAQKQLASFDEINKLSEPSGGGGGGGGGGDIPTNFDGDGELDRKTKDILATVGAIGAGLLAWRIARGFMGSLSAVAGIAMAVGGAVLAVYNYLSAWKNGIDWRNFLGTLVGLGLVVGGLALAFGSVAAGIAAIVGGVALVALGFHDMMNNGMNLQNTLTVIAGLLAGGLGIGLLTGSWIPLLIAGIASIVLALVSATGNGATMISGLKTILRGFLDFFTGIFKGDIERTVSGINQIFFGLKQVLFSIVNSIQDAFNIFLDWIEEKTGLKLDAVREFFNTAFSSIKKVISGLITFLTGVFTGDLKKAMKGIEVIWDGLRDAIDGVIDFLRGLLNVFLTWLSDTTGVELEKVKNHFDTVFNAAKDIVNDIIEGIKGILNGLVSFISNVFSGNLGGALDSIKQVFSDAFTAAVNVVIDIINGMIGVINNALTLTLPEWEVLDVMGLSDWKGKKISLGRLPTIPKLAEGAVIPPNREFMAVLGDQKNGTNIETPLSTMVQAFRQAMNESGRGGQRTIVLEVDKRELGRVTFDVYNAEAQRVGVSLGSA